MGCKIYANDGDHGNYGVCNLCVYDYVRYNVHYGLSLCDFALSDLWSYTWNFVLNSKDHNTNTNEHIQNGFHIKGGFQYESQQCDGFIKGFLTKVRYKGVTPEYNFIDRDVCRGFSVSLQVLVNSDFGLQLFWVYSMVFGKHHRHIHSIFGFQYEHQLHDGFASAFTT